MFKCNFILVAFFQFIYWKSSLFGTFATHAFSRLFKCEQCDREETQKHLLSTHKRVGTKFKCNQCDRIACQWCSLKSHKKRKYIKYQCDHCHYKPSKNQLKNNDRNIKGQINIRFHLPKPHHITHSQSWLEFWWRSPTQNDTLLLSITLYQRSYAPSSYSWTHWGWKMAMRYSSTTAHV